MEDQQQQANTRKTRGKRKHPNYGFLFLVIVLLTGVGTLFSVKLAHQQVAAQETEAFEAATSQLKATISQESTQSGLATTVKEQVVAGVQTLLFIPEQSGAVQELAQALEHSASQWTNEVAKQTHTVVVTKTIAGAVDEKVQTFAVDSDVYHWTEKGGMKKIATHVEKPIYINGATSKPVTFKDLVKQDAANVAAIQQVVEQKLLDQTKAKGNAITEVLNLPSITQDTTITYEPEQVTLHLPENKLAVTEVTLAYHEISGFIDTTLVSAAGLADTGGAAASASGKLIALTFDDGPNSTTTPQILDILKQNNVLGTFFMLGKMVDANPAMAKRVQAEGHEIGSHTYNHQYLGKLSAADLKLEVNAADKAIYEATGVLPKLLRPPYGAITQAGAKAAGKAIIQWDIDSLDWKLNNAAAVVQTVQKQIQNGGIILMHDIHTDTVQALPTLIAQLKSQGYQFVTIDQLLHQQERPLYQYFGQTDSRLVS
jgi:peptidoglycan/xylan/chitin deacetylase (PgdA/CDA1 family)